MNVYDCLGSYDFFGLNHYWTYYAANELSGDDPSFDRDSGATLSNPEVPKKIPVCVCVRVCDLPLTIDLFVS